MTGERRRKAAKWPRATLNSSPTSLRPLALSGEGLISGHLNRTFAFILPFFRGETLKRCPAAVWPDAPIDSEVPDLRATRSAFLANFYQPHPRQAGCICPQFELVTTFCSVAHDGLSSGNPPSPSTSTYLHPHRRRTERPANFTLLRSIHVSNAFSYIPLI